MIKWLAFDIGCIECGECSDVIGVFNSEEEAQTACDKEQAEQEKNWSGQHAMEVFEIEV